MPAEEHRVTVKLTDEQFAFLWNAYPHDESLIAHACQHALFYIFPPNPTGRTATGVRIYRDDGFNGSGYVLVHGADAKNLDWCLDNGYYDRMPESEKPLVWDENPERDRLLSIQATLREWAW